MTIKELIEALSKFDSDTPVVVGGYEGGYNDVTIVKAESIQLNVNKQHYYGAHGRTDEQYEPVPSVPFVEVVYLGGFNPVADESYLSYR
ncbi:MAG: hypothetical protein KME25_09135 [Symplocastrum torsivum CPER-KK1]|jgi:hypothetical protein|uniref:Uncharacterized protein n=1 Tax=Symplocastrum torsivum CPER-KK1 TaxID=450513 RepID=A0A951PK32_9CYAN|nr:hypothetical protein [Symplocastrum torsivum CPER-KK1]